MSKIIIAGAGAAGMMAAIAASGRGHEVLVFERNEKTGKKLYITGKGRCNLTNACDTEDIFAHIARNPRFLYSSIYRWDNQAVMDFFEENQLALKTERGDRVFPRSDHSSDVIRVLNEVMRRQRVRVATHSYVTDIIIENGRAAGVRVRRNAPGGRENPAQKPEKGKRERAADEKKSEVFYADAVILAAGGYTYPSTGSDGNGYSLCEKCGHTISPCRPALVPMTAAEPWIGQLQGLSLRNVRLTILDGKKKLYSEFGEMLFTHFGISGPLVLTASSRIPDDCFDAGGRVRRPLAAHIDLKPALSDAQLDDRLVREFAKNSNRSFKNILPALLPAKLIPVMMDLSGIDPETKGHAVTKEMRRRLGQLFRAFPLTITGLRDRNEGIITRGGVSVKEVDPSTMQSKILPGLYLCGELLDTDAVTGGFNLQIAWSTGYAAGCAAGEEGNE